MGRTAELVVATNNAHKLRELARLFPGVRLLSPPTWASTSTTRRTGRPTWTTPWARHGTCTPGSAGRSWPTTPGWKSGRWTGSRAIFSSRYGSTPGGAKLTDADRCTLLLEAMQGREDRACFFVCCMVVVFTPERFAAAQEIFPGLLARAPRGIGGFGYDPIVLIPERGRTVAELSDREKDRLSHRGRAARRVRPLLRLGPD